MRRQLTLQNSKTYISENLGFYKAKHFLPLIGALEQRHNKILSAPWIHPLKFSALLRQKHSKLLRIS